MKKKPFRYYTDPVHGIITFPTELIHDVIDHPFTQRLRRITQCGLSHYVFPGANHTRFHHTIGVAHLANRAVTVLQEKGVDISLNDIEATCLAALIHDLGHGPYSHALESIIVPQHHETLSIMIANKMNKDYNGALDDAISIIKKTHPKKYLSQLIASQLDIDRMDYLARDSFYTGIEDGQVGVDRLIRTFDVVDERLVTEEKALQAVEKFLMARHHMYWQVYIHKSVLAIQNMLIMLLERIKELRIRNNDITINQSLRSLLENTISIQTPHFLDAYIAIDDLTIMQVIKDNINHPDSILSNLCTCLLDRKIFGLEWIKFEKKEYLYDQKLHKIQRSSDDLTDEFHYLIKSGTVNAVSYSLDNEIEIITKKGKIIPLSEASHFFLKAEKLTKSFLCYPRHFT